MLQKSTHIEPVFNEEKASQVAAIFIKLCGGKVNYMKLIKLMYLAERQALLDWGRPITYDSYFSLPKGPILSNTLNIIRQESESKNHKWFEYISKPSNYEVSLLSEEFSTEELSEAEEELINEIFQEYGQLNEWQLVEYTHSLPEWENPEQSSKPISYRSILKAGGKSPEEIECIEEEISHACFAANIFTTNSL